LCRRRPRELRKAGRRRSCRKRSSADAAGPYCLSFPCVIVPQVCKAVELAFQYPPRIFSSPVGQSADSSREVLGLTPKLFFQPVVRLALALYPREVRLESSYF